MSLLVNADGSTKTYVVVDTRAKTVIAAFNWVGESAKALKKLQEDGGNDLAFHNITHPKCPDWLQELIRSDGVYCRRRAESFDASAAGLRRKAADIISKAEEYERWAAEWRELSEAATAAREPGM